MNPSLPISPEESPGKTSFPDKLLWLLKGFVYPIWSRPYYKESTSKPMGAALVFLVVFGLLQAFVSTASVAINLSQINSEIKTAYLNDEIPDITIKSGIATVSGTGRYIIESNRQIIAADTTGSMREIDTTQYSEGVLLTRNELHIVNEDGYQVLLLSDLNKSFGNPIVLDSSSVSGLWSTFSMIINIVVLGGGIIFFTLGRFIYVAVLGLLVWGAVSLKHKDFDFAKILITGIYANVPTTYIMFILRKIGISFFGLRGFILFVIWGIAIAYLLKKDDPNTLPDQPTGLSKGY